MIRSFGAKNFCSIRDLQSVGLEIKKNATDPASHFVTTPDEVRLPLVVAIYGANASGKTALLKIPVFLSHFISDSVHYKPSQRIYVPTFLSNAYVRQPTEFFIEFDLNIGGTTSPFLYELSATSDSVEREALFYTPGKRRKLLFERIKSEINSGPDFNFGENDPLREKIRNNASVISVLAQFNHGFSRTISRAAGMVCTNVTAAGHSEYLDEYTASQFYFEDKELFSLAKHYVREADLGIDDIVLEEEPENNKENPDAERKYRPVFMHRGLSRPLRHWEESHGTRALYRFLPYLLLALKAGGIAIIDELDSDLHPMMIPKILDLFYSKETNPRQAQLIFSGHNPYTLQILQKDEVFFTEKDEIGKTTVTGLREIKTARRSDNYFFKYVTGALGGVPKFK